MSIEREPSQHGQKQQLEVESLPPAAAQAAAEAAAVLHTTADSAAERLPVVETADSYFRRAYQYVKAMFVPQPITGVHTYDRTTQAAERKSALQQQRRQLFQTVDRLRSILPPRHWLGVEQFTSGSFEIAIKDRSYRVLSALDAGGQGQVFRVEDTSDHRRYLLKVNEIVERDAMYFSNDAAMSTKELGAPVRRVIQEVAALKKLNGRHAPRLIDAQFVPHPDDHNRRIMVEVMEEAQGQNLYEHIKNTPPTEHPENFIRAVEAIMTALDDVHRQGILHLDLKPSHIYINTAGDVQFIDFGTSYDPAQAERQKVIATHEPQTERHVPSYAQRDADTQLVTAGYAPREQYAVSTSYDVYSLGRSILVALYRVHVHDVDDINSTLPIHEQLPDKLKQVVFLAHKLSHHIASDRHTLPQAIDELHRLFPDIFQPPAVATTTQEHVA